MPTDRKLQNLDRQRVIVDEKGAPTLYFIRFIQERGGFLSDFDAIIADLQLNKVDKTTQVIAGTGLDGGGALSGNVTLSLEPSGVTPGVYGDATNVPQITVDTYGRITSAVEVAITGGSGGGILPVVDGSIPPTFIQNPDGSLVYTEIL